MNNRILWGIIDLKLHIVLMNGMSIIKTININRWTEWSSIPLLDIWVSLCEAYVAPMIFSWRSCFVMLEPVFTAESSYFKYSL